VLPFVFTQKSKSDLGWDFLAVIETGRFRDYKVSPWVIDQEQRTFRAQLNACQADIQPGPNRLLSWSVPEGTRDPESGESVHDDLIMSAALCALLDKEVKFGITESVVLEPSDPLERMSY
jgi:hypothetical protein